MKTIYFAEYESRKFVFRAVGKTRSAAYQALLDGLHQHTKQFELREDWFYPDSINVQPLTFGAAYRDYDEI